MSNVADWTYKTANLGLVTFLVTFDPNIQVVDTIKNGNRITFAINKKKSELIELIESYNSYDKAEISPRKMIDNYKANKSYLYENQGGE